MAEDRIVSTYELDVKQQLAAVNESVKAYQTLDAAAVKSGAVANKFFTDTSVGAAKAAKSFGGFGYSISQFAREIPNLAQSFEIFFRSIGNQFAAVEDDFKRLRAANADLVEQGKKPISTFKALGAAIFSASTLLQIGVTLLVVYGAQLLNLAKAAFTGKEAFDKVKGSVSALNEAYASKNVSTAITDFIKLRVNVQRASEGFVSKKKVVDDYNNSIGVAFGRVKTLEEAEQGIIDNTNAYIKAIVNREAATLLAGKAAATLVERTQKIDEREKVQAQERITRTQNEQLRFGELQNRREKGFITEEQFLKERAELERILGKEFISTREQNLNAEIIALDKNLNSQLSLIQDFSDKSGEINGKKDPTKGAFAILNQQISELQTRIKDGLTTGANTSADLEKLDALEKKLKEVTETFDRLRGGGDLPNLSLVDANFITELEKGIKAQNDILDDDAKSMEKRFSQGVNNQIKQSQVENEARIRATKEGSVARLNIELEALREQARIEESAGQDSLETHKKIEEKKTEISDTEAGKRKDIEEALIKGAFAITSEFEQELFNLKAAQLDAETNQQLKALDKERAAAEANGKLSLAQEEEFARREAAIKNRAAQEQRKADLAEILVKGALAVINALASSPPPLNFINAGIISALTGVQYAFAQAQPLPQFAKGTERVRGGIPGRDSVTAVLMPDEAVINARENMKHTGLAKAWNDGNLEPFIMMKYVKPYLDEVNNKMSISNRVDNSVSVRNGFNDKRIVNGISETNKLNKKIAKLLTSNKLYTKSSRLN